MNGIRLRNGHFGRGALFQIVRQHLHADHRLIVLFRNALLYSCSHAIRCSNDIVLRNVTINIQSIICYSILQLHLLSFNRERVKSVVVNQRNVVKIQFVTVASLSGICISGSGYQYGFWLSRGPKILKRNRQSLPVAALSCDLCIAGFCHLIIIGLIFRILIIGTVGNNGGDSCIRMFAIGFSLCELHPNSNTVRTCIQYGIKRISVCIHIRFAHIQESMVALVCSSRRLCIQTSGGHSAISNNIPD